MRSIRGVIPPATAELPCVHARQGGETQCERWCAPASHQAMHVSPVDGSDYCKMFPAALRNGAEIAGPCLHVVPIFINLDEAYYDINCKPSTVRNTSSRSTAVPHVVR
jgi:hypothetical protein